MKTALTIILVFLFPLFPYSNQVVENSATPLAKNAGRVLLLQEEFRITDEQGDFFFESPKNFKIAPDGSIFIQDEEQLLKFSAEGKFLKNLFRKGQGPGELERLLDYIFSGNEIIVFQNWPGKIMCMDMEGKLLGEVKPEKPLSMLIACYKDRYIMAHNSPPKLEKKGTEPEIIDIDWKIMEVLDDGKVEEVGPVFPAKWFAQRLEKVMIANYIVDLSAEKCGEKWLAVHHTQDYGIAIFDLDSKQVVRRFTRKYKTVKMEKEKKEDPDSQVRTLEPPVDDANDIQKLFVNNGKILAMTSTIEKGKGVLVDVFNKEGEFIDNFYLPIGSIRLKDLSRYPITLSGDALLIKEIDEEGFVSVVKYRMLDESPNE
jgi:hypothetical protein